MSTVKSSPNSTAKPECSLTTGNIGCRRKRNGNMPAGREARRHGMASRRMLRGIRDNADAKPHAVGQKTPNAWGFHDMLGNVWEWCQDWFWGYNKAYGQSYRSLRGGSYFSSARFCRAAQRWGLHANSRSRYIGFRLLAAKAGPFDLSPPIDDFPKQYHIYDAIRANDFDWALRIVTADPDAVECPEGIPPPLEHCGDEDKPEWTLWLLDHGADIERLNHDYGSTALRALSSGVKRGPSGPWLSEAPMQQQAMDLASADWPATSKMSPPISRNQKRPGMCTIRRRSGTSAALIAKDIGKSSSYFESLASTIDGGSRHVRRARERLRVPKVQPGISRPRAQGNSRFCLARCIPLCREQRHLKR